MGNSKNAVFKSALDFEGRQLSVCLKIIAEQKALLNIVRSALPSEIAPHIQHCLQSGNRLLVYAETANWTSQIRFFNTAILNKIAESGQKNISTLQVRICPQVFQQRPARSPQLPSKENIVSLLNNSEDNENDILGLALSKLANTLDKRLKAKSGNHF